jgi:acyl-CoA thioesterase I
MASKVDLPDPEAPTTATASPRVTARSISRRMTSSEVPLFTLLPMPRALKTLLFCMLFAFGAPAAAQRSILILGDSLSAAYGISQARGWVALLDARLKRERPDYIVANASVSGDTTAGGAARLGAALERHRPAVVVLELGGNDGLRGLPVTEMKKNLAAMIEQSRKAGARVLLLGMKIPPNYGPDYADAFEAAYADLAKHYQTALVPFLLEDFADKPDFFLPDRIHPTEAAQPLMAERVMKALQPLLK